MLESAISGIAVPIFEQLWKAGSSLGGYMSGQIREGKEDVRKVENILKASQDYRDKYETRHGQIKIMPGLMKDPTPLDSIYTAVKFLDDRSRRYFATPDDLEQLYRDQGQRRFQAAGERHDGMNIAKEKQYLMVLGGPGIGKSTFLKKLGLEALKGAEFTRIFRDEIHEITSIKRSLIPVFIELKAFKDETIDLAAVIAKEFEICGFPDANEFTELSLEQGKLLLLLDGLDEVPTRNMNLVVEQIEAFSTQYGQNTFVASCRTAAYRSGFNQFSDVTIAEFDDEQIELFIQQWFSSELDEQLDTARTFWKILNQSEYAAAKELAQTPLLLTFLCLVYDRSQLLPEVRSSLYGDALNILLKDWAAEKRLERDPIYRGFHAELEKSLLADIAYQSFKEDQLFFSSKEITALITAFLADTLNAPKNLDGMAVLDAIEMQQGILVKRASGTYSFSHLTLQEYLTAYYIKESDLVQEIVSQHLFDEHWQEVLLLVSGLMVKQSHILLLAIEQQTKAFVQSQKLHNLLVWVGSCSTHTLNDQLQQFSIRVLALFTVIEYSRARTRSSGLDPHRPRARVNDRARDLDFASLLIYSLGKHLSIAEDLDLISNLFNILARARASTRASATNIIRARDLNLALTLASDSANELAQALANACELVRTSKLTEILSFSELLDALQGIQSKIPSEKDPSEIWYWFGHTLEQLFLDTFHLEEELVSFTNQEAEVLANYLYAVKLIIDCKNAAARVSRQEWEAIEARLLTPQGEGSQ